MKHDVYGINVEGLTAGEVKAWMNDIPDNYKLNFYELENEYGEDETLLMAVKPK